LAIVEKTDDYYVRGNIFSELGDLYSSKHLKEQLSLMVGGKWKSKIAGYYLIRRCNLHYYILYDKNSRKKLKELRNYCFMYYQKGANEFETGEHFTDLAYNQYNLAVRSSLMNKFRFSQSALNKAKIFAEKANDQGLIVKIVGFKNELKKHNKDPRDYVEELGIGSRRLD
jgi:hypothetical protein